MRIHPLAHALPSFLLSNVIIGRRIESVSGVFGEISPEWAGKRALVSVLHFKTQFCLLGHSNAFWLGK
jgi:hypothetical protein